MVNKKIENNKEKMTTEVTIKRNSEFVLGLIGGIIGFLVGGFELIFGAIGKALANDSSVMTMSLFTVLFSILAIIGCVVVKHKPKLGGLFMLISAFGGLISAGGFFILPFVLLMIAGIMGVVRKDKK